MKKRFSKEQLVRILREGERPGKREKACRKHGITDQTYCRWRRKYQGVNITKGSQAEGTGAGEREAEEAGGGAGAGAAGPAGGTSNKRVAVGGSRDLVRRLVAQGVAERTACRAVRIGRASYRYKAHLPKRRDTEVRRRVWELALANKRYGY